MPSVAEKRRVFRDMHVAGCFVIPNPFDVGSARWLQGTDAELEKFAAANRGGMATDRDGAPVFLAKSAWEIGYVAERSPNVKFLKTRERHEVQSAG